MTARDALGFHEVAGAKVFDPSGVDGHHRLTDIVVRGER
jgi:hypothetical protein